MPGLRAFANALTGLVSLGSCQPDKSMFSLTRPSSPGYTKADAWPRLRWPDCLRDPQTRDAYANAFALFAPSFIE
jgi:hypothetical protein